MSLKKSEREENRGNVFDSDSMRACTYTYTYIWTVQAHVRTLHERRIML